MKLYHRILGQGQPLLILHGLFGNSDNWQTHARKFAEYYQVILIDQRNHGHSDWSDEFSYELMAEDVHELITGLDLKNVLLMGHSLGGKTAMWYAQQHPEKLEKLLVVDMGIQEYGPHHQDILKGLGLVDLQKVKTRGEVEAILEPHIPEFSTRQFLMKNLYWKEKGVLAWRMNVPVLSEKIGNILIALPEKEVMTPTLFIRGERSGYIRDEKIPEIEELFPDSTFVTIEGAGHWVHAERPEAFVNAVLEFLVR